MLALKCGSYFVHIPLPQFQRVFKQCSIKANDTIQQNSHFSLANSIVSFSIDLLFGQMAYADELPTCTALSSSKKNHLNVGVGEKLLILSVGAIKHVWSGIKQGSYMAGEKLGIVAPGTTAHYTNLRNQEMQEYNSTPVGQSRLRPWVEFGTETLVYSVIPCAAYGRIGLTVNAALTGGIVGGLEFVSDGQASSKFINTGVGGLVGAGVGVAVNKIGRSLLKLYDVRQTKSKLIDMNNTIQLFEEYLGKESLIKKNPFGDAVFINKTNTKRIRFDINNPHGDIPHGHVEYYNQTTKEWLDFTEQHRIYMKDSFKYLNKPRIVNKP
jgi:hypothetical protein